MAFMGHDYYLAQTSSIYLPSQKVQSEDPKILIQRIKGLVEPLQVHQFSFFPRNSDGSIPRDDSGFLIKINEGLGKSNYRRAYEFGRFFSGLKIRYLFPLNDFFGEQYIGELFIHNPPTPEQLVNVLAGYHYGKLELEAKGFENWKKDNPEKWESLQSISFVPG
jgi:hypothetical protein